MVIKQSMHTYCLHVLFLGMHGHWLKCNAKAHKSDQHTHTQRDQPRYYC